MSHTNNILNFHQNSGSNEETYTMMLSSWTEPKRQGEDPRGPRRNGNTKGRERKRKTKWGKKEKRKQDRSMIFWGQCGLWKAPDSEQRRSPWNSHSKGRHTKQKSSFVYKTFVLIYQKLWRVTFSLQKTNQAPPFTNNSYELQKLLSFWDIARSRFMCLRTPVSKPTGQDQLPYKLYAQLLSGLPQCLLWDVPPPHLEPTNELFGWLSWVYTAWTVINNQCVPHKPHPQSQVVGHL